MKIEEWVTAVFKFGDCLKIHFLCETDLEPHNGVNRSCKYCNYFSAELVLDSSHHALMGADHCLVLHKFKEIRDRHITVLVTNSADGHLEGIFSQGKFQSPKVLSFAFVYR